MKMEELCSKILVVKLHRLNDRELRKWTKGHESITNDGGRGKETSELDPNGLTWEMTLLSKRTDSELEVDDANIKIEYGSDDNNSDSQISNDKNYKLSSGMWKCPHCEKIFSEKYWWNIHLRTHTGEKPHSCNKCTASYYNKQLLLRHLRKQHKINHVFFCRHCSEIFRRADALKIHIQKSHAKKLHECEKCGKAFTKPSTLIKHMNVHRFDKPFVCPQCDRSYKNACSLTQHIKFHNVGKKHRCTFCNMQFYTKTALALHTRVHTEEKPYSCDECGMEFKLLGGLKRHRWTHSSGGVPRNFQCEHCPKAFSSMSKLKRHILQMHTEERDRPFPCNKCGKSFFNSTDLNGHRRSHTGKKPFKCNLCPKKYTTKNCLTTHLRIHRGELIHKCEICEKSFARFQELKRHNLRKHETDNAKMYPCSHCGIEFKSSGHARRHETNTHAKSNKWKCKVCRKTFASEETLEAHKRVKGYHKH